MLQSHMHITLPMECEYRIDEQWEPGFIISKHVESTRDDVNMYYEIASLSGEIFLLNYTNTRYVMDEIHARYKKVRQ